MSVRVQFDDLAPGELDGPAGADDEHIVCWFEGDAIALTPALWARILVERKRLGRVLTDADVLLLVETERGDDRDL